MKKNKVEINVKLPEPPTEEEIDEDLKRAGMEDVVFSELAERLSTAAAADLVSDTEAAFLQARRLSDGRSRLQLGVKHLQQQLELLQRESARLNVLVNDARGHVTQGSGSGDSER